MKKYTLITGATSGLGKEFARLYAKDGNNLIIVGSNEDRLSQAVADLQKEFPQTSILSVLADLSKAEDWKKVVAFASPYFINNLVNAAGFGDRCDFKDMDVDFQVKMTEVNCNALLYFTRSFLNPMLENNEGHIINVSSIASYYPGPYMCTYHATKAYVTSIGQAISYEIRKSKVKLLTLCPGPFLSGFTSVAHNDYTFEKIKPWTAEQVAIYGYKKSKQGKMIATVGNGNKFEAFISRFVSKKTVFKATAKTIKEEK